MIIDTIYDIIKT